MYRRYKRVLEGLKHCPTCDRVLPELEFHKNRNRYDRLQNRCRDCIRKRDQKRARKKLNAKARLNMSSHLYPLAEFCELCPEDDRNEATQRHHPDYSEPKIYVSTCSKCHSWLHSH